MTYEPQDIIERVLLAFENRGYLPKDVALFQSFSPEVDHASLEAQAKSETWMDLPHEVIHANAIALAFGTPKGFGWMLPAWMVASICLEEGAEDVLTGPLLTCLTRPDDEDAKIFAELEAQVVALDPSILDACAEVAMGVTEEDKAHFIHQTEGLSTVEVEAIRAYLEFIEAEEGDVQPVFGAKLALERHWARSYIGGVSP